MAMTGLCTTIITDSKGFHIQTVFVIVKKVCFICYSLLSTGNRLLEDCVVNYSRTSVRMVEKCVNGRNLLLACVNKTTLFKSSFAN